VSENSSEVKNEGDDEHDEAELDEIGDKPGEHVD